MSNLINQHTSTLRYYKFCKRLKKNGISKDKRDLYYKNLIKQQNKMWDLLSSQTHKQSPIRNQVPQQKPPKHQIPVRNPEHH